MSYNADEAIHLYHSAAILKSVGNKGFVFSLSLHVWPHTEWEVNKKHLLRAYLRLL